MASSSLESALPLQGSVAGLIPGWGTKISLALLWKHSLKKKKKKDVDNIYIREH